MFDKKIRKRVAKEILGYKKIRGLYCYDMNIVGGVAIPAVEHDVALTFGVLVHKMYDLGWCLSLDQLDGSGRFEAEFWRGDDESSGGNVHEEPAMAICLAALEAVTK